MKTKDITLIAILSASLTAGKMALSPLPNIEIVTFLLIVYTILFGPKKTIFASVVFVSMDLFLYGFGTWIIGYYLIWPTLILIAYVVNKATQNEYVFACVSGAFGLGFGLFFALVESVFYGLAYGFVYWLRGIPFDIVHGVSNFLIALFLFKPILNTISMVIEKKHRL